MRRALVLAALLVGLAGCGGGETVAPVPETMEGQPPAATTETPPATEGDPENGKKIYLANGCGSCHTLSDAGTSGTVGPNLDEAKPDLALAIERITNGSGVMPPFKDTLNEKEIVDVATYVVEASNG